METEEIETIVTGVLETITPEPLPESLNPDVSFRDQMDLDSLDYVKFVLALESRFGVRIPATDYTRLSSLNGCRAYLESLLRGESAAG